MPVASSESFPPSASARMIPSSHGPCPSCYTTGRVGQGTMEICHRDLQYAAVHAEDRDSVCRRAPPVHKTAVSFSSQRRDSVLRHRDSVLRYRGSVLRHRGSASWRRGFSSQHRGSVLRHRGSVLRHRGSAASTVHTTGLRTAPSCPQLLLLLSMRSDAAWNISFLLVGYVGSEATASSIALPRHDRIPSSVEDT